MAYKLVCIVPLHGYQRGQAVTDPATVERLLDSHDHHFVKVFTADEPHHAAPKPALDQPAK